MGVPLFLLSGNKHIRDKRQNGKPFFIKAEVVDSWRSSSAAPRCHEKPGFVAKRTENAQPISRRKTRNPDFHRVLYLAGNPAMDFRAFASDSKNILETKAKMASVFSSGKKNRRELAAITRRAGNTTRAIGKKTPRIAQCAAAHTLHDHPARRKPRLKITP